MFNNEIIYEENVIISLDIKDEPYGFSWHFDKSIEPGLSHLSISYGYMQIIDLMRIIRDAGIEEKTIFMGWKRLSPEILSGKYSVPLRDFVHHLSSITGYLPIRFMG